MKIVRLKKGSWGKVRAFFDLETKEGFTIKGFKMVEGENGMFIGFPSQKNDDGEYYDTVWCSRELKQEVVDLAKAEYDNPTLAPKEPAVEEMPF